MFECTPIPNDCPTGEACVVDQVTLASGTVDETNCEIPGTGAVGASCATDGNLDCQAGLECAAQVCEEFCRTAADCVGIGTGTCDTAVDLVVNGVTYGFCE